MPSEAEIEAAMKAFALIAHDLTPEQYDENRAAATYPTATRALKKSIDAMSAALSAASAVRSEGVADRVLALPEGEAPADLEGVMDFYQNYADDVFSILTRTSPEKRKEMARLLIAQAIIRDRGYRVTSPVQTREDGIREAAKIAHSIHLAYAEKRDQAEIGSMWREKMQASTTTAAEVWQKINDLLPREANSGSQPEPKGDKT